MNNTNSWYPHRRYINSSPYWREISDGILILAGIVLVAYSERIEYIHAQIFSANDIIIFITSVLFWRCVTTKNKPASAPFRTRDMMSIYFALNVIFISRVFETPNAYRYAFCIAAGINVVLRKYFLPVNDDRIMN